MWRNWPSAPATNFGFSVVMAPRHELFESYAVPGTPYGLLIDKEGVVRTKGTTNTRTDLETLLRIPN